MDHCSFCFIFLFLFFYIYGELKMRFCSWMVIEFYTKTFCIFAADQYIYFFLPSPFVHVFVVKPVFKTSVLKFKGWPFSKLNKLFNSFHFPFLWIIWDCRERESEGLPLGERGCSCTLYQDVLKEKLCCSNSFFCCSLDCQDVLTISVLRAWCFNK